MTILCKATEQYCTVVLFVLLYSVVLTFSSVDQTMQCDHSFKATEQYCTVVLFVLLHSVILTFLSVDQLTLILQIVIFANNTYPFSFVTQF